MLETSCADKPDKSFLLETIPAAAVPWYDPACEVQIDGLWRSAKAVNKKPTKGFVTIRYQQRQEEYFRVHPAGENTEEVKVLISSTYPKGKGNGCDNVAALIKDGILPNRTLQSETKKGNKRRTYTVGVGWDDEQPQKYAPKTKEKKEDSEDLEEDFESADGTFE